MNDLDLAIQCQKLYDSQVPVQFISGVSYAMVQNDVPDIIFRGTADLHDAEEDLEALMGDTPIGRVHKGAWEGLIDVFNLEYLNIPKDKLVRFSGHSLGAMRASMFAMYLYSLGWQNLEVVTFGCPRIGDSAAMLKFEAIKSRTYQNWNNIIEHDFFTTIPIWLPEEPYASPPNRIRGWSAPTAANEWKDLGIQIEAHSLKDCYIPLVKGLL